MFKKIFLSLLFFIIPFVGQAADKEKINLYFFYGDGCPHCAKEEIFLDYLEKKKENIKVYRFEVWDDVDNAKLLKDVSKSLGVKVSGVPFLVIGDKTVSGFYNGSTTGRKIENIIEDYEVNGCSDIVSTIVNGDDKDLSVGIGCNHDCDNGEKCSGECVNGKECSYDCGCSAGSSKKSEESPKTVSVPFWGEINVADFSLPLITIIIAAIDGFNPCAMWVLLFLISLLLGMQDKKRMWILGSAFIIGSAFVYFLFLSAWLNLFMFLGVIKWVRILIAITSLGLGGYHFFEYLKKRDQGCKVEGDEKRRAIFDRLRNIVIEQKFWLAFVGIVLLSFAVNLVELVCSAGLPAVYTQVLSMSSLPTWKYYSYLILYIVIFILDDLLVFLIAMTTLKMKAISGKYTRWSGLVGGIIMIVIGILLIFKPGWLMFG